MKKMNNLILFFILLNLVKINCQFEDFFNDDFDFGFNMDDDDNEEPNIQEMHLKPIYESNENGEKIPTYDLTGKKSQLKSNVNIRIQYSDEVEMIVDEIQMRIRNDFPNYKIKLDKVEAVSITSFVLFLL